MEFSQIAFLIGFACIFAILVRKLKQPLIVGYILSGLILGFLGVLTNLPNIGNLGGIGISLLLFLVGLEMNFDDMKKIGKVSVILGVGQILITSVLAYVICLVLGFASMASFYIALAMTFSSTILVVSSLSEKKELGSLHGKLALGYLLIQDFFAIFLLIFLAGASKSANFQMYFVVVLKAFGLMCLVYLLAKKIMPFVFKHFIDSNETAFVFSIAWVLLFSAFVTNVLGFNLEIGGFLAGISLSTLKEHLHIASKTRPLRDFFLIIFFLDLGASFNFSGGIVSVVVPVVVLSVFVCLVKPLIILSILRFLNLKKRTSFLVAVTSVQISEFSFVLMSVGVLYSHLSGHVVSTVVLVGLTSIFISTYIDLYSNRIYKLLEKRLSLFEKNRQSHLSLTFESNLENHIILIGCDRTGRLLASYFGKKKLPFVVLDFNPEIIEKMEQMHVNSIFGDAGDPEILAELKIEKAKAIVSTISHLSENLIILEEARKVNSNIITIFTATTKSDALRLYEKGASYVVVPENAASEHIRYILQNYLNAKTKLRNRGKHHFERLLGSF